MMKITPKQVERVHRLVRELCANCDEDGNCILLDDGEAQRCVQLISLYGIYCNYFKDAVLPSDRELYEQIKWERDAALAQLKDYGVSLGEKADVVEVRHGRWERVIPTKSAAKWSTKVSCSQCHDQGYERYNYCPNCGAYMMGESNGKCE